MSNQEKADKQKLKQLEKLVEQRTAELAEANASLVREIDAR